MTREDIARFFAERENLWTKRDPDGLAACHAVDGTVTSPIFGRLRGREQIAESYYRLFEVFPDWSLTTEEVLIDGDRCAQPFSVTATHVGEFMGLPGSKRRFQIQGVRLFRMAHGTIQEERRVYDFTNLLMQIGVLKSKPGY